MIERGYATDAPLRHARANLRHAAFCDDATACEHRNAIGQRFGLFQVMRGQHDRAAFGHQRTDRFPQRLARIDVQAGGRFVQKQDFGATGDGQRELHAPLLAAGELSVTALEQIGNACKFRDVGDGARIGVVTAKQCDQLADRERVRHTCGLQHGADAATRRQKLRRLPEHRCAAFIHLQQAQQMRNRRGLAGAIGAKQGEDFAAAHLQVHAIQRA